eukprot:4851599-Amphidinium_carterae.1
MLQGFGFIAATTSLESTDYFCHVSQLKNTSMLNKDDKVEFTVAPAIAIGKKAQVASAHTKRTPKTRCQQNSQRF